MVFSSSKLSKFVEFRSTNTKHTKNHRFFVASKTKFLTVFVSHADKLAASEGRELFIKDFFERYEINYRRKVRKTDIAMKIPFVREYAKAKVNDYFREEHSGQVVSLEDAIAICSIPGRVSVIDCPCQKYLTGKKEKRCILFGTTADIVENIPEFSNISDMGFEDAVELLKATEKEGKVHTVWTFMSPYIGAICNCNQCGCLLFHMKNKYRFAEIVHRGHEIAVIDRNMCNGCGNCQIICQFDAVEIADGKAEINFNCQGCGVCRGFCPEEVITLVSRYP